LVAAHHPDELAWKVTSGTDCVVNSLCERRVISVLRTNDDACVRGILVMQLDEIFGHSAVSSG
jgi:hypothetical protein